jgi:transcription elongation factor Elf1
MKNRIEEFTCPICGEEMLEVRGSSMNREDGYTVYCGNLKCSAQEVMGHGRNVEAAYEIVKEKYKPVQSFSSK